MVLDNDGEDVGDEEFGGRGRIVDVGAVADEWPGGDFGPFCCC